MDGLLELLKGIKESLGSSVSSAGELSEYLLRNNFVCSSVSPTPKFADLPTRAYTRGNLEISFNEATDLLAPGNRFVVLYARTSEGVAYLPLNDVDRFIEHFGKKAA